MGKRGPAPTPTPILKLRGSWRGKSNKQEPHPEIGAPDCPTWLSKAAQDAWAQITAQLDRLGVLTKLDGNALARYCDAFVRWRKAAEFLDEKGEVYPLKDEAGKVKCVMPWPQVAIYHKLAAMLVKLEAEFGLTPSSRSRIHVSSEPQEQSKSRFFGKAG